jgi:hypothetical protein
MIRSLVRSIVFAASISAVFAQDVAAQTARPRIVLAPQVGAVVSHSRGGEVSASAGLVAEVPVGRGWSVAGEWSRPYGAYAIPVCNVTQGPCVIGTELRVSGSLGVMVRPFDLGRLEPYAGVSAGAVRWSRPDESGVSPMASLRAGVDLQIAGPFGLRADLVRRVAWTDTPNGSPLHADMLSLGARIAFR